MSQSPRRLARLWMRDRLADPDQGWNAVYPQIALDYGVMPITFDFSDFLSSSVRSAYIADFSGIDAASGTHAAQLALHTGETVNTRTIKHSPFAGIVEGIAKVFIDHEAEGMEEETENEVEAVDAAMIQVFNRLGNADGSAIYCPDHIIYNLGIASQVEPIVQEGDGYRLTITFQFQIEVRL